jgi:hypothetical protein
MAHEHDTQVAAGSLPGDTIGSAALDLTTEDPIDEAPEPLDTSSSQRLKVLRDLNKTEAPAGAPPSPEASEAIVMSGDGVDQPPANDFEPVDSIEDQIDTAMTQTLKALNVRPKSNDDDDDDDDDTKKGFFSRFRRN